MWSLYQEDKFLTPLTFSNGKIQEDIVQEVLQAIKEGNKIIFIKGKPGTGKSAIALNIAKEFSKASVVVPVKYLQKQYEEDYMNKYSIKKGANKLKITILNGRNNHACLYNKDHRADFKFLPCIVEIRRENEDLLRQYIRENPHVEEEDFSEIKDIKRFSVAAACPYWSPIMPKELTFNFPGEAEIVDYKAVKGQQYSIVNREKGCTYYNQFNSYANSDVIIFNSKKYELECLMNRKPETEVEVIDECDEFLDNLGNEKKINLNILSSKISQLIVKSDKIKDLLFDLNDLVLRIMKESTSEEIKKIKETKVAELLQYFIANSIIADEEELEPYYEVAKNFQEYMEDTYISFTKNKFNDFIIKIVNINLKKKLDELLNKNKVFVMMSGTLHSASVLKNIFGIENFKMIEAEPKDQGKVIKKFSGIEKDFRQRHFDSGRFHRKDYLLALNHSVASAIKPTLVHVNAFSDLPSEHEKEMYGLKIMTREKLSELQDKFKQGELLQLFKEGKIDMLYSTKCGRGVDLPGSMCNSIVLTKYPYPSMSSIFWKVLRQTNPQGFMDFYFDKANREYTQRLYRALRSKDDKVYLFSPDLKALS